MDNKQRIIELEAENLKLSRALAYTEHLLREEKKKKSIISRLFKRAA